MEEKEKKERTVINLYIKENDTHQRKNFSKLKVHHSKRNPFVKIGE